MADYFPIPDTMVDPDAPLVSDLMYALRDNPVAIAEGASGAPRIADKVIVGEISSNTSYTATGLAGWGGASFEFIIGVNNSYSIALGDSSGSFGASYTIPQVSINRSIKAYVSFSSGIVSGVIVRNIMASSSATAFESTSASFTLGLPSGVVDRIRFTPSISAATAFLIVANGGFSAS